MGLLLWGRSVSVSHIKGGGRQEGVMKVEWGMLHAKNDQAGANLQLNIFLFHCSQR